MHPLTRSCPMIQRYVSLPLSASIDDLNAAFCAMPPDAQASKTLAQYILDDLKATFIDNNVSRLSKQAAIEAALPKLKDLGKSPQVAEVLATPFNLRCLLSISTTPDVENLKENHALRCIANTCLLIESARVTFVGTDVNGGDICLALLQRTSSVESIYLASRILFLCTASIQSAAAFIEWMVENKRSNVPGSGTAIDILSTQMDELLHLITAGKSVDATSPEDAMIELLKLIFNLCVHYPKLVECEIQTVEVAASGSSQKGMSDPWNPRLNGLLPPLLRAFHGLPTLDPHPLVPPMSHIIHPLIFIPVNTVTRSMWFFPQPSIPHSLSRSPTPPVLDTALRACQLLDATLASFFRGNHDPDDIEVRNRFRGHPSMNDSSMSDIVSFLVLLLTHFSQGDEDAKIRIRNWFVPENLDRTEPLERRDDALGRCLRLLQSVYHPRLGRYVGEMFFAMYDSSAANLTALGYGNFAGFLFNKGLATGPPTSTSSEPLTTSGGLPIDPITGTVAKEREPDGMTDEEKEQEAEKLFVLFDRLERMGALPPSQNPIRKAMQRGSG